MRNVNDEIIFKDYAGVEKEGVIIDCTPDLKYKVQTKNKIKWIISEKNIISPVLVQDGQEMIVEEREQKIVPEKSTNPIVPESTDTVSPKLERDDIDRVLNLSLSKSEKVRELYKLGLDRKKIKELTGFDSTLISDVVKAYEKKNQK